MLFKLSAITTLFHQPLPVTERVVQRVSIDSRDIKSGDIFVAIKGERFDGHDYVEQAITGGASAVIVSEDIKAKVPVLLVPDTIKALGEMAHYHRQQCHIPVIGITGSCGKTTTKSMLASILSQCAPTLATEGTLNNHIGMPLTILKLRPEHQFAVIECGANHPGEIAYLSRIAMPNVALVTNAAPVHLAGFGNLEGVARAKGEMYENLLPDGIAVLNMDDPYAKYWQTLIGKDRIVRYSRYHKSDVTLSDIYIDEFEVPEFTIVTPDDQIRLRLPVIGEHNMMNALAAAAVAYALEVPLSKIQEGLKHMQPVAKRLVKKRAVNGAEIIDDSYNANPVATSSALKILAKSMGPKVFVFGEMGELGDNADYYHQQVGEEAKQLAIDYVFTYGDHCRSTVSAFGRNAQHFATHAELIAALQDLVTPEMTVLVKGSRATKMEQVVAALTGE